MRLNYVIVYVRDMSRSVAFYRDTVGLPLRFESPGWSEFATAGCTLALHPAGEAGARDAAPADTATANLPPGGCRPGVGVSDLDAFHERMVAQGVACLEPPREVFGVRVARCADPDGLSFSVGEQR